MHGYGITEFIQCTSTGVLRVEADALYPAVH
jgi:DNA-binding PadR family transcriptional regulator